MIEIDEALHNNDESDSIEEDQGVEIKKYFILSIHISHEKIVCFISIIYRSYFIAYVCKSRQLWSNILWYVKTMKTVHI